jgi:predicted glycoside hydrolase/deacetylase ChbG (UPF0249 family)
MGLTRQGDVYNISAMTLPSIILCADDFGISERVDRAILDLCVKGRLSAVTCMSAGPRWAEDAPALKKTGVAAGLHITLTELSPLAGGPPHPPEKILAVKSWLRLLDRARIEREIRAQFTRFIDVWGAPPAFIDGHQHVHVLPVVRDVVISLRDEYAPKAWVRNIADLSGFSEDLNYWILAVMGWRFRGLLAGRGIAFNNRMRGMFDFGHSGPGDFAVAMEKWRSADALVYCHPGAMPGEAEFLGSDIFGAWIGTKINLAGAP